VLLKTLKEKERVNQRLKNKINALKQNKKFCYVKISGVQKEKE